MTLKSEAAVSKGMQRVSAAVRRPGTKAGMSMVAERLETPLGQCMRSAVQKRVASSGESHSKRKLSGTGKGWGKDWGAISLLLSLLGAKLAHGGFFLSAAEVSDEGADGPGYGPARPPAA